VRIGNSHVLPIKGPAGTAAVLKRIIAVATINLSATGSRKAPKAEVMFCGKRVSKRKREFQSTC
jgi:hypothetical protein